MFFRAAEGDAGAAGAGAAGAGAKGAGAGSATEPGAGGEADKGEGSRSAAWKAAEQHKAENAVLKAELNAYKAKESAAADDLAKKNGEHEKLASKYQKEAIDAKAAASKAVLRAALVEAAVKNDLQTSRLALVDVSKVTVAEDGTVTGVDEAFAALKKNDPGAFGSGDVKNKNTETSRGGAGGKAFDASSIKTPEDVSKLSRADRQAYIRSQGVSTGTKTDFMTGQPKAN